MLINCTFHQLNRTPIELESETKPTQLGKLKPITDHEE